MSNVDEFKYQWYGRKDNSTGFLNAKKQPLRDTEDVTVFYSKQPTYNPQMRAGFKPYKGTTHKGSDNYRPFNRGSRGDTVCERFPVTTLAISRDANSKLHPTQKPVALMEYLIRTYTNEGDTVLDNCMGSGTTGVACVNTGRFFIGIERDTNYFSIAEERIRRAQEKKDGAVEPIAFQRPADTFTPRFTPTNLFSRGD
jgi:site-specific DNA-methyltransferase (adenine-specific)